MYAIICVLTIAGYVARQVADTAAVFQQNLFNSACYVLLSQGTIRFDKLNHLSNLILCMNDLLWKKSVVCRMCFQFIFAVEKNLLIHNIDRWN